MARFLALVAALWLSLTPHAASAEPQIPPSLPQRFTLCLSAHPDPTGLYGWMPDSGIPWDYAYQYLAGGANTGSGWSTWNTNAQFPLYYARGAAKLNAVPVFTYYMLLQSAGPCDRCDEAERDLANLNHAPLMARYYEDFALLMKRLGPGTHEGIAGYGGPTIVHVEPDLSGYAMQAVVLPRRCFGHCSGAHGDPTQLRAAVSSSGHPDVQGLPDTYVGFHQALLRLRDRYAPNVVLATHVSSWMTGQDVGSSADARLEVAQLGAAAASFTVAAGEYDVIFTDVADRDAGYYKEVLGRRGAWWDRLNVALPNFARWEQYVAAIAAGTGKPIFVWQIPLGNQRFRTMNNTPGHYQDNRAEYFFEHVEALRAAGIAGLLFGRGNAGSTTNTDDAKDGVTNPPPLCTSDGLSTGQVCADQESVYPDDDGGYLRLAARAFYDSLTPR